jgi:hypothetical protein
VPVPPTTPGGPPPPEGGDSERSRTEEEARRRGQDAVRRLQELVEKQRSGARKIPGEIEELVRMVPPRGGQGGGQKDPKDGQKQPQPEDPRDARKRLEEEERRRLEREEKERKEKEPGDPKDRSPVDPDDPSAGGGRDPDTPAWVTGLPPELRDAFSGGKVGGLPAKYQDLVIRYLQWLARQRPADGAAAGSR